MAATGRHLLLIDPSLAVGLDGYQRLTDRHRAHAHYLGGAVLLWTSWLAAIGLGATAGVGLPSWMHLEFVIPLFLIGQAIPKLANPTLRRATLTAATVALLTLTAPLHLGTALAIVAGITVGLTLRPAAPPPPPTTHPLPTTTTTTTTTTTSSSSADESPDQPAQGRGRLRGCSWIPRPPWERPGHFTVDGLRFARTRIDSVSAPGAPSAVRAA